MVQYEWTREFCEMYAEGLRPMVKFDHRPWAGRISEHIDSNKGYRVLDIATGPGFLLVELAGHLVSPHLMAHDESAHMLEIAEREAKARGYELEKVRSPAEEVALEDDSVDIVTCKQLLHEARDPERVISEIRRVLKPGGQAFIIDFDADGARLPAVLVRMLLRVTRGKDISGNFWKSFRSGLPGREVRDRMIDIGFTGVEYIRKGFDYMMIGSKGRTSA